MKKRFVSVLLILVLACGALLGAPRAASAATMSVGLSNYATAATGVAATVTLMTSYEATSYVVTFPSGFVLPSTVSASTITINGTAAQSADRNGYQVSIVPATTIPAGTQTIVFSAGFNLTNPSSGGSYTFAVNKYGGSQSEVATAAVTIGGGSGSGTLTLTPSSTTAGATNVALTVTFTPSYYVSYMSLSLPGFTFLSTPSTSNVYVSGGTGSLSSVSASGSTLNLTFGTALSPYSTYSLTITPAAGLRNPTTASTYTVTASLTGSGSQTLTGTITIGGGSGSGTLTLTPSSTTAGATNVALTVTFTPSYYVSYMSLSLPGFTFLSTPSTSNVYVSGGTGSLSSVSASGSTLNLTFGTALSPYSTYSLTITPAAGLMNPTTASTYTVTASLTGSGSQTLTGTITIGGGSSGGLTVTPSSTAAGATYVAMTVNFVPTISSVTYLDLYLSGYTFLATPNSAYVSISGSSGPSIASVSQSATSTVRITFSTALLSGASYTLYFSSNFGLMNPATANTYLVTATLYGTTTQVLTGNVPIGGTGGAITNLSLTVYPLLPATAAQYYVSFTTSTTGTLQSGNYVYITFPSGTEFPSTYNYGQILVNNVAVSGGISVSGTTMTVPIPSSLTYAQSYISVQIYSGFGIKNPATNGYYNLQVWTSKDTTPVTSNSYQVYGTTISGLAVQADPRSRGASPRIQLSFVTSSSGYLTAGTDAILVQFSSNVVTPPVLNANEVTVNGIPATSVSLVAARKLSIVVPVTVGNSQQVIVVLTPAFGIVNPSTVSATVTIQVSTSKDVSAMSTSYTTTASQITQPQVVLSVNGAGKASGYTVTFQTGAGGALSAGSGRVYVTFPVGTVVPVSLSAQYVKVNGSTASIVTTSPSSRRVEVTVPVSVSGESQVQLVIDAGAGIVNPSTARSDYTLSVYTTAETTPVTSATFAIVNLPTTTAVTTPSAPDGLNGYYKTRPTVSLSASSPSGLPVTIYYSINSGAATQYTSPVQIPDGSVTFSYYGRDTQGNQESAKQLIFKVDSTVPAITVVSPADGSKTATSPATLTGTTEAGSSVVVNNSPAVVQPTGQFSATVALQEGANSIQIVATDPAGNVGQLRIGVTLDTKPPILTITEPKIYATVMTQQITVSGKTEAGATVTVAGSPVSVGADGSFSVKYMFTKEGLNTIEISATDAAGNVAKATVPVTYVARTLIRLQVGNKTAMVNDASKTLQAAPVNVKGVVNVPLRFIGEAFGATVEWEPVFKMVRIQLGSTTMYLQVGSNYASVNGKKVLLQGVPTIVSGTTMVPIRFISEAFGAEVVWTEATKGITITYPKP